MERRPRNIFYVESRARLKSLFPREHLFGELERLGISLSQTARQSGVDKALLHRWKRGDSAPYPKTLLGVLDSFPEIDRSPFAQFLANQGPETKVCPYCGRPKPMPRGQLKGAAMDAKGRRELRRRPDGSYELPCKECSNRMKGPALKRRNEQRLRKMLGPMKEYLVDDAKAGKPEALEKIRQENCRWMDETPETRAQRLARVRAALRRPRTEAYRRACAVGNVVARALKGMLRRPFYLCRLCGLITHSHRPGMDRAWHRACYDTWRRYRWQNNLPQGVLPPPLRQRGPKPETRLTRNYRWLMARRGQSVVGRKIGQMCREVLASARKEGASWAIVTDSIKAFIRLLPGSWDLVFSDAPHVRRSNIARQELVPLPLEIQHLVGDGGRDPLIRRLLDFGMAEAEVARLTGMGLPRAKGIAAGMKGARPAAA